MVTVMEMELLRVLDKTRAKEVVQVVKPLLVPVPTRVVARTQVKDIAPAQELAHVLLTEVVTVLLAVRPQTRAGISNLKGRGR